MQTKQQIQQLLTSTGISPNKRLGQHFLIDLNLMRLLADSAHINNNDIVLEVGCGTGSLTEAIARHAGYCLAVEIDEPVAKIAKKQLAKAKNVEVINTDILESKNTISRTVTDAIGLARKKYTGRVLLVANLPYNVASPLMVNLITGPTITDSMYVTVQKQVAGRMTASPGSSDYGTLSILLSATGDVKTLRTLKPMVFWPRPEVDSAMVSFVRRKDKVNRIHSMELFSELVNLFMGHRRKMLKACTKFATHRLAEIHNWGEIFEQCSIDPTLRPGQLSPENYIAIANCCYWELKKSSIMLKKLRERSGNDARSVKWRNVTVRLRNRGNHKRTRVDEALLKRIFAESELSKSWPAERQLLLILDDKTAHEYKLEKRRAGSFTSADLDLILNASYYDRYIDPIDIWQKNQWQAGVYIPKITAKKWKKFAPYFTFVLGHELEHVRIILQEHGLHRCTSWLAQYDVNIRAEAGTDNKPNRPWEFPWEQHCDRQGKKLAENIFGKQEFDNCLVTLIQDKMESKKHKPYLALIRTLEGEPHKNDICSSIRADILHHYDKELRKAAHKIWGNPVSKECKLLAERFDLKHFLPLS